jgi:uncharacterized protein YbaP (TraB family)
MISGGGCRDMKFIVAGLILITFSGAALLWRSGLDRVERAAAVSPVQTGPERMTHCMVWKAERGKAAVWFCGSIHLMRETDYPLPEPYNQAFAEAKTVVTEYGRSPDGKDSIEAQSAGKLPPGETLEQSVSPLTWAALNTWCLSSGTDINTLKPLKAWRAANSVRLINLQHFGYSSSLGIENHFLTAAGSRKTAGLETMQEQLSAFDRLELKTQEKMILQMTGPQNDLKARSSDMAAAWHEGDAPRLATLMEDGMRDYPEAKKLFVEERNLAWLPKIEAYLDGTEPVMIIVGSGHLAGPGSLIDLLEKKGAKLTQMEYRTIRLPMPLAGNNS